MEAVIGKILGDLGTFLFGPVMLAVFFGVVRLVDIIKPPPTKGLQALPGGWGVMVDDLVANLYALALNWLIFLWTFSR